MAAVTVNPGGQLKVNASGTTGNVILDGGSASVDGTSGATVVNMGSVLGGTGTVANLDVNTGGTVSPGNSIGTLHVAGDAAFHVGSFYNVEITKALDKSDRLVMGGKALLRGGVVLVRMEGSASQLDENETKALFGQGFDILRAGTIADRFAGLARTVQFNYISPSLDYSEANVVYLRFDYTQAAKDEAAQKLAALLAADAARKKAEWLQAALLAEKTRTFSPFDAITRNQKNVWSGIRSQGMGTRLFNTVLFSEAGETFNYNALSGDVHASLKGVLVEDGQFLRDAAQKHIRAVFGKVAGSKSSAAETTPPTLPYGPETKRGNAVAGEAFAAVEPAASTTALWGTAYGSRNHAGSDGNAAGFSRNTGGLITGLDGVLAETWRFGLLAGYGNTSLNADRSHASVDTYQVGVYGGTKVDALTLSLGTSFAHHEISTRRKVAFGSIAETDKAEYAANTVQVFGEAAYRIDTPYAALEPFAAAAYTHLKANDFAELGGITALSGLSGTTDLTTTTLGVRASHSFVLSGTTVLTARGMAGWRHAYGDRAPDVSVALAGADGMLVAGLPLAQDTALAEAGLSFDIGKATTIGVTYTGQFSQQAHDNAVKADLTVRF